MATHTAQPIGKAFIIYGTVKAVSPSGVERILGPNSPIYANDRIVTGPDGSISIVFADNQAHLDLGRMSDVLVDEDVFGGSGAAGASDAFAQVTDMGLRCQTSASAHPASSWMDAVVERAAITPRQGYPVDINALFFDSLGFLTRRSKSSKAGTKRLLEQYLADVPQKFALSFWVAERQFVADGHDGFRQDAALRPNQLWLLASSFNPFSAEQSRSAIQRIRSELLTSYGLRSLSPLDSRYRGSCKGTQTERDLSYHQGTVWPWLAGVFFEASLKYFPRAEVAAWMQPLTQAFLEHLNLGCVGQISEIFDGDFPHEPRGAPAQAWSAAELLRTVWMIET